MQQTSFNFGPSHNTKDPNTSTASSSGIDDLVSKLGALLLGANSNNEQMTNSLKNAVKEGIIEANKHDVRINDAEEREAERRHKELMHHLSRIASLGSGEKAIGKDGAAKDNKDGFGIIDALKWGGVAAGAMGLVANIDNLVKVFGETSKTVGDVSNQVLGMVGSVRSFGETMGKLVDNAFSKEGAIGAILGAFVPGGVIAKAFFALLGGATTGSIFGPGTSNTPGSNPSAPGSTPGGSTTSNGLPTSPGTTSGGFMQSIRNTDINNNAGMASAAAFGLGGGGLVARGARALGTYVAVDAMVPELDENGQPKETLLSKGQRAISSLNPYNPDGSLNQNVTQGAVVGGAAGIMAAKVVPKNKVGLGMAAFAGGMGYIFGNSETRQGAVELIKDNLPDVSSLLGITAPKNAYNTKLKEYEDEIAKLEKERDAVFTFTPEQAREVNTPEKWNKKREELTSVQTKLKEKIAKLKAEKEEFKTKTDTGNRDILKGALKNVPVNPNAGESSYFSMEAGASVALGAGLGAFGGPGGALVGAVGGAASSSTFVFAINSIEEYIDEELGQKVDIIQLALSDPGLVGNILVQYAHDRPWASGTALGALAAGILNPGKGAKVLIGIAKNLPKVGTRVTTATLKVVQPTMVGVETAAAKATAVAKNATDLENRAAKAVNTAKLKSDIVSKSAGELETLKTQATAARTAADGATGTVKTQLTTAANNAEDLLQVQTSQHTSAKLIAKQAKEEAERLTKLAAKEKELAEIAAEKAVAATQPGVKLAGYSDRTFVNALEGVGGSAGRTAVGVGIGAGVAYSLQNQYDILGSGDFTANSILNPSTVPANPSGTNLPNVSLSPRFTGDGLNIEYAGSDTAPYGVQATKNAEQFKGIVMHHAEGNIKNLVNYGKNVDEKRGGSFGYHFYVGENGEIIQGAPMDKRTNHVKPGSRVGLTNSNSIGISMVNAVNGGTPVQVAAAKKLAAQLQNQYGMDSRMIFGHGEIQGDKMATEGQEVSLPMRGFSMDSPEVQKLASRQSNKNTNIPLGNAGPMGDLVGQILNTESRGGDINAFWGDRSGKYNSLLGGKQVGEMTFGELREFQQKLTKATAGHVPGTDKGTSAVGIGQWLGSTLFGKNYNDTGFLNKYFGENTNYNNVVFDEATQKDMLKEYLKDPGYGNLTGFLSGKAGTPEEYAKKLGKQWSGVKPENQQKQLVETLKKLQAEPGINVDTALDKVMGQMNKLGQQANTFKDTLSDASKKVSDSLGSIGDFLSNVTTKASELLPQEFKDLFDLPAMKEFLDPFLGGESKSTLAHPKRTFTSLESQELRNLLMGTPNISGEQLAASSSALKSAEQRANQQQLGAVINTSSGNGGESIHGQPIAGLSGNINTHFPGDIDAISARIYQWTDAPMFYAAGKMV